MHDFKIALKIFLCMAILTGLLYPYFIIYIAHTLMPYQAYGSLTYNSENEISGSLLIAQNFNDPTFFWPRPSAINYNPVAPSGGSNLGPTSKKLKEIINVRTQKLGTNAPVELLYASGSGLDPHISLETAYFQIPRVSKSRQISPEDLKKLIDSQPGSTIYFQKKYINVLQLNQMLLQASP